MEYIQIPKSEYLKLKEEVEFLKDKELISKFKKYLDLLFMEKYALYMGDNTDDLQAYCVNESFDKSKSVWDEV
ncbi:MAG: hypothetical protein ACOYN6_01205 [Ignavibacteria bacterium]|jgi:hypothetical protein